MIKTEEVLDADHQKFEPTHRKTIFCDIDGCIFKHAGNLTGILLDKDTELLPGVREKFNEWDSLGYQIILTTGRKECSREHTKAQLLKAGIFYDQLVMGLERGERVVINDYKTNSNKPTASGICLKRNVGLKDVKI